MEINGIHVDCSEGNAFFVNNLVISLNCFSKCFSRIAKKTNPASLKISISQEYDGSSDFFFVCHKYVLAQLLLIHYQLKNINNETLCGLVSLLLEWSTYTRFHAKWPERVEVTYEKDLPYSSNKYFIASYISTYGIKNLFEAIRTNKLGIFVSKECEKNIEPVTLAIKYESSIWTNLISAIPINNRLTILKKAVLCLITNQLTYILTMILSWAVLPLIARNVREGERLLYLYVILMSVSGSILTFLCPRFFRNFVQLLRTAINHHITTKLIFIDGVQLMNLDIIYIQNILSRDLFLFFDFFVFTSLSSVQIILMFLTTLAIMIYQDISLRSTPPVTCVCVFYSMLYFFYQKRILKNNSKSQNLSLNLSFVETIMDFLTKFMGVLTLNDIERYSKVEADQLDENTKHYTNFAKTQMQSTTGFEFIKFFFRSSITVIFFYSTLLLDSSPVYILNIDALFLNFSNSLASLNSFSLAIIKFSQPIQNVQELIEFCVYKYECPKVNIEANNLQDFEIITIQCSYVDKIVLRAFSLKADMISPSAYGFVGKSGSGKSTVLKTIMTIVKPTKGEVLIGNLSLVHLDVSDYMDFLAVVLQESVLFKGSLHFNLVIGNKYANNISIEQCEEVCSKVQMLEYITTSSKGFFTEISGNNIEMSGGQRQRIGIARSMLRSYSKIHVLDEMTSALDPKLKTVVYSNYILMSSTRLVFCVTHNLLEIQDFNICAMHNGEMKEFGAHGELMSINNGIYRNLCNSSDLMESIKGDMNNIINVLRKCSIFQNSEAAHLAILKDAFHFENFNVGANIFVQGETGSDIFIIVEGTVGVDLIAPNKSVKRVANLQTGDIFGEMALIESTRRSATVVSTSFCVLLRGDGETIKKSLTSGNFNDFKRISVMRKELNKNL